MDGEGGGREGEGRRGKEREGEGGGRYYRKTWECNCKGQVKVTK